MLDNIREMILNGLMGIFEFFEFNKVFAFVYVLGGSLFVYKFELMTYLNNKWYFGVVIMSSILAYLIGFLRRYSGKSFYVVHPIFTICILLVVEKLSWGFDGMVTGVIVVSSVIYIIGFMYLLKRINEVVLECEGQSC